MLKALRMATIIENLNLAIEVLKKSKVADPIKEAKSLLMLVIKKDLAFLIAHKDYKLSEKEQEDFNVFLKRRASREPIQYIRGSQEFYGLNFMVSPGVFIPRPETELIVEKAIEILKNLKEPYFGEIGVGSGCISISILHKVLQAKALGVDISEKALQVTKRNAQMHGVAGRLKLLRSDLFENINSESFDLIVSNPPYISEEQIQFLQDEVRKFEPLEALNGGAEGLLFIKKIISTAPKFLKQSGWLIMEIGFDQADKVVSLFDRKIWQEYDFLSDLQGIKRTVVARVA
jgi:release factor glutamine methyltransferase